MPRPSDLRAFEVSIEGWQETAGIHVASSASKARAQAFRQARDVGMMHVTFQRLRVRRAPDFDALAEIVDDGQPECQGWDRDYAIIRLDAIVSRLPDERA